ncbi:EamA family transporter RarD [Nitrincola alkalilacustris]|uniref:EamA family transporter RarD n=1 Tax=Nitrincola alkalilacustris TaxID=1571224 RepID=UPI00124EEDCF|nr:EamA family transporter RarD [Nitrincola alkalilacustris]
MQLDKQGIWFALGAYIMWGIAPLYFHQVSFVPPMEVLSHRVVWSCVLVILLILALGKWRQTRDVLKQPRSVKFLLLSSALIGLNWLVFIWAINNGKLLDASLGYFINPLISVGLGMLFFKEKLRRLQVLAVSMAVIGVLIQLILFGELPWVALVLAFTFAFYGMVRKKVGVDSLTGLGVETFLLVPLAVIYLTISNSPTSNLVQNTTEINLWLAASGLVTTLPLLCFAAAANRLPLSVLGFFQYISPSMLFLMAIMVFGEPFEVYKLITFAFIWLALACFVFDAWYNQRSTPLARVPAGKL